MYSLTFKIELIVYNVSIKDNIKRTNYIAVTVGF